MRKTSFIALILAIILHIIFALVFWYVYMHEKQTQHVKKKENRIKISLKEMPKTAKKKSGLSEKKVKKSIIAPPMPKGKQLKKIIKKPFIKYKKPKIAQEPKLNKKLIKPQKKAPKEPKTKELPKKETYIPLKKDNAMAWMYEDKSANEPKKELKKEFSGAQAGGTIAQMKELYGSDWGKLTYGQQKYMLDNQEIMRRITQEILTRVARVNLTHDLQVNKKNVIEFYLHPNGDMSDFRFLSRSGYYVLDDTTRETIEYAYSRYPRPKEKILIRYNVYYHLSRY